MRSTTGRFLAAILLTAAAGFALSQEASMPQPPGPDAAASVAPAESPSRSSMILGEWVLAGVLVVAFYSITQLLRRRSTRQRPMLVDLKSLAPELKSIPVRTRL